MSLRGYKRKSAPAPWATEPALGGKPVTSVLRDGVLYETYIGDPLAKFKLAAARRSRPRRRSRRMSRLMAYYNEVVKPEYLEANPLCAVHYDHHHPADQIHHTHGKAGTLMLDKRFFKGVCAGGHAFIQDEPAAARRAGLLCPRGQWNHAPEDAETRRLRALMRDIANGHRP